jgi:Ca2+-binding RTX toxin-like protein
MAKVILNPNELRDVTNSNDEIFGTNGIDAITIANATNGVRVDQNIESVALHGNLADYLFQQAGNNLKIYSGATLVSTVIVQGDADGTQLTFGDGAVSVVADRTGTVPVLKLGNATVATAAAGAITAAAIGSAFDSHTTTPVDQNASGEVFTLQETYVEKVVTTPASSHTEVYWGYNPHAHDETGVDNLAGGNTNNLTNEGPADGGVPLSALVQYLNNLADLDFVELGLVNVANGIDDQSEQIASKVKDISVTQNGDGSQTITVTTTDGTINTAEVSLGEMYFKLLHDALYDAEGNSRLFEKVVTTPAINSVVTEQVPIKLTTSANNGGTVEPGYTTAGDDIIVAGRPELLHQAYIDGGAGYNVLEVDMKGIFAQPLAVLNVQEIRVENLPHIYTAADGSTYPDLSNVNGSAGITISSALDLTRAIDIEKLVVTEGESFGDVSGVDLGPLTIVGIRNGATARFEGAFTQEVTLHYGQGLTGALDVEFLLGDVTTGFNIVNNASVMTIHSLGTAQYGVYENHMHYFNAGEGTLSRMYIDGPAVFAVEEDLSSSFNSDRPAIIDASHNTGGLDVTLNGHYNVTITGTTADDEIDVEESGTVVVNANNGNNTIDACDSDIVTITSGTGNDIIYADDCNKVNIAAGDGDNTIEATDSTLVTIVTTGTGTNNIVTDDSQTVTITTGGGNDTISSVRGDKVVVNAGSGANIITVSANDIAITTNGGNDTITVSGMETEFLNGDGVSSWNNDHYEEEVSLSGYVAPGAKLVINAGAGNNTITLGRDVQWGPYNLQFGITALEGSSITGSNIKLFVENSSDITEAAIQTGAITAVELKQELTITEDQFAAIGAGKFSVFHETFGATEDLNIVVDRDVTLSSLVDLSLLDTNVRLRFEIHNGATLTLSAAELHKYVAWHGINGSDGLNGKVVITDAGPNFDAFDNGNDYQVIDGGSISGSFLNSDDVTILHTATGFERPEPSDTIDAYTINADVTADQVIETAITTIAHNLKIVGSHDVVFQAPVSLNDASFTVDFSTLVGTVTGLTLNHFEDVTSVKGNNSGTRINVNLTGDVGSSTAGLKSSGVAQYVVTAIDQDGDGNINENESLNFYLCDQTKDVQVIGLKGNAGNTIHFYSVPWGQVHPSILLEGDGYANWDSVGNIKVDGNPNTSDIGNVIVDYFTSGAPAVININNGGVALGVSTTGGERTFSVGTVTLNGAVSAEVNVTDGDATIASVVGSGLKTLTVDATEDVTVTAALPTSLTKIDASDVTGKFTTTLNDMAGKFTFIGSDGGTKLTLDGVTADTGTSIDGGALGADLTIKGTVTLDEATLTNVNTATLSSGASLTLNFTEFDAIGAADIKGTGTLNLVGLDGGLFDVPAMNEGITIGTVTLANDPVVTLNIGTVLTGITSLEVPEGTVLNLSATQFLQLGDLDIHGAGSVHITGLTQAEVGAHGVDFDLDHIDIGGTLTITLAESVDLSEADLYSTYNSAPRVDTFNVGDGMTLTLGDIQNADGVAINGGVNSTLAFTDDFAGIFEDVDASGFNVTTLNLLAALVADRNVDLMFNHLPGAVVKNIYTQLGDVTAITQHVTIEAGNTVDGNLIFNPAGDDTAVENFILTMDGGTELNGNLRLSFREKQIDGADHHLKTLTINSEGTTEQNVYSGETANIITGDITPLAVIGGTEENNLLNVTINADQDLTVEGDIIFNQENGTDAIAANDKDDAIATLTVTGDADVVLNGLDTDDEDVDALVVDHTAGAGSLTVTINGSEIDASDDITINGSATNETIIHIDNTVNLSDDTLSNVSAIVLEDGSELTLSQAQYVAIGTANFSVPDLAGGDSATLNIVGLDNTILNVAGLAAAGITVDTVTIAAGSVTLNGGTDLTGVNTVIVPEGGTLTLTAAQFQQLAGIGSIVGLDTNGDSTIDPFNVVISDLKQTDVTFDANGDGDTIDAGDTLDLSGIVGANVTVQLADNTVTLGTFDNAGSLLSEADLSGAQVVLADNQTIRLVSSDQADGLVVNGGANTTIVFMFDDTGLPVTGNVGTIDAAGYHVTSLNALNVFVDGRDVENLVVNLPSTTTLVIYDDPTLLGFVTGVNRVVDILPGVTVPDFLVFNDWQDDHEVRTLSLTMEGGSEIDGNLRLSTTVKAADLIAKNFDTLTIHSQGTAENHDVPGQTANIITGDITPLTTGVGPSIDNTLLKVNVTATQDFILGSYDTAGDYVSGGDLVFNVLDPTVGDTDENATAVLTLSGTSDVTMHSIDVTDDDINELDIVTTGYTGNLTVTGGSFALESAADALEKLVISGSGDVAFDTDVASSGGIDADDLSVINASAQTGSLSLGLVSAIDTENFAFTSGTGVTTMTLGATLDIDPTNDPVGFDDAGWSFDYTTAAAGSVLEIDGATFTEGALNIALGTNAVLLISSDTDLTALDTGTADNVSITGTHPIVLGKGVTLTLTAAQANGLNIIPDPSIILDPLDPDYNAADVPVVNVTELGTAVYNLSGINHVIAGTLTLADNDVTLAATTDLGAADGFTVVLNDISGDSNSLAGQTIRFETVAQAERAIDVNDIGTVGDSSANVVWYFKNIAAPVDTVNYDAALGRVWFYADLVNNYPTHNVEDLFTTLPSSVLRVDFTTVTLLDQLIGSSAVDRTVEFASFETVGNMVFSDIGATPEEHIQTLTLKLGGEVTLGNILVDDQVTVPITDPTAMPTFDGLTIESHRALSNANPLANTLNFLNDNDNTIDLNETVQPVDMNTVGNIGVGPNNGVDLLSVTLDTLGASTVGNGSAGDGAQLSVGTISYGYVPTVADPTQVAELNVTGANNINIVSLVQADADITDVTVDTTGFTATLTAPGASPAFQLGTTESLTFVNDGGAPEAGPNGAIVLGSLTNAGIAGAELSDIDASGYDGDLDLGIVAQIDSTNDDNNADGDTTDPGEEAFYFTAGTGVTTMNIGTANGLTPSLAAGSEWVFDYTTAAAGSSLTISDANFVAGGTLRLIGVPLLIVEGTVDLTVLGAGLILSGCTIEVLAGETLTLTAAQASTNIIIGEGTLNVIGDYDAAYDFSGFTVKNIDLSGITGLTPLTTEVVLNVSAATTDFNIIGSAFNDVITTGVGNDTISGGNGDDTISSGNGDDVLTGGAGNDTMTGGLGNDTFTVDAGTDTVTDLSGSDVLVVSTGATANVAVTGDFTATAATANSGTANLTLANGVDANLAAATGTAGYTITADLNALASIIVGSAFADTITGGNGDDAITGGNGADTLTGGLGSDTFNVDGGTDTVTDLESGDVLVVSAGATANAAVATAFTATAATANSGTATLTLADAATANLSLATGTAGYTITAALNASASTITGSAFADTITGGNGDDTLSGGNGADIITGAAGNDTMSGGAGNDILVAEDLDTLIDGGTETDTVRFAAAVSLLGDANLVAVENVQITNSGNATYDFTVQAEALNITGYTGNDTILGGSASDVITGGVGTDTLTGKGGNDTFNVNAGTDAVTDLTTGDILVVSAGATANAAVATAFTATAATVNDGLATLTLADAADADLSLAAGSVGYTITAAANLNASTIVGSVFADTITGSSNGDTITGGNGDDTIKEFVGADTVDGGLGTDTLMLTATSTDLNGAANADLVGVERVTASTAVASVTIDLSAQTEAFVIIGSANDDTITGGNGADTITGGAGADDLTGGVGNDSFIFAAGHTGITLGTADTIADFTTAADTIATSKAAGNATIADGTALADFAAFITAADGVFTAGAGTNDIYVAYNALGSGDAYVAIDENDSGSFDAGDSLIILTGINLVTEIAVTDFL